MISSIIMINHNNSSIITSLMNSRGSQFKNEKKLPNAQRHEKPPHRTPCGVLKMPQCGGLFVRTVNAFVKLTLFFGHEHEFI